MTQEELIEITSILQVLDPTILSTLSQDQIKIFLEIASVSVDSTLKDQKKKLGIALLLLDFTSLNQSSGISSQKIGDVAISYRNGAGTSKWRQMYESLLAGEIIDDYSLRYVGI